MRNTALSLLVVSAGLGFAGESPESPKQAIVPATAIPSERSSCPQCLTHSGLFLGAGADYLLESDNVYYTGRVGYEFASHKGYTQSLFLEVGWLDNDDGPNSYTAIPVTINYEYKRALTRCLNFYIGGGAGVAFTDGDTSSSTVKGKDGLETRTNSADDGVVFLFQGFAGLTYCLTENVELYTGVRYLWSDDIASTGDLNDFSVGAGLRVKF